MEEQKMNEKESLEFIAQMIRVTKQSIGSGSGNKFLMYGYTAAILSIVIYALVYFTGNSAWSAGWFLMFLPFLVSSVREKRNRPKVVTYTDRMINETWRVIGVLFVFTVLTMIVLGFVIGRVNFGLMMPLVCCIVVWVRRLPVWLSRNPALLISRCSRLSRLFICL